MPPRGQARGQPPRGGPNIPPRGGPPRGAARGGRGGAIQIGLPAQGAHVTTVGVKRPNFGTTGRRIGIFTNHFNTTMSDDADQIYHYDVVISAGQTSSEQKLPIHFNHKIISKLQEVERNVFTPRAVYDGRKNIFAARELPLGQTNSREFAVTDPDHNGDGQPSGRPPKVYKVKITKVAQINREVLDQFIQGRHSLDNPVLTALTALNVVIRMDPVQHYAFNVRSFFTNKGKDLNNGYELWRGYFQSLRPGIGRMTINIDIATGIMYKPGPLINLCLEFFGRQNAGPDALNPTRGFPDRERLRLQRFLTGLKITAKQAIATARPVARTIKKLSAAGADRLTFSMREGGQTTVAQYFAKNNQRLKYPGIICVEVGSGALIPLEMCEVPKGQIIRKQIPPDKVAEVVKFSAIRPAERLKSIKDGLAMFHYGQSEYVREFGMTVDQEPLHLQARVLQSPSLKYGQNKTVAPRDGAWNMIDKHFFRPAVVGHWILVCFEAQRYFNQQDLQSLASSLVRVCQTTGMQFSQPAPLIKYENGQGDVIARLKAAGKEVYDRTKAAPSLFVLVLPDQGNTDIYTAIKHFGDCVMGVPTQCLKSGKCKRAKDQYWANIALKINGKLGGINVVPDPTSALAVSDPNVPTVVMGADAAHPPPGSDRPSFTALVSSVDSNVSRYIATSNVQTSRREIIADLQEMAKDLLGRQIQYAQNMEKTNKKPARIIFYRDGVAEGQFQAVKDNELLALKRACQELGINPKITMIVVGKRHHTRLFPEEGKGDRTGNCPAGTVVDTDIAHPLEFDFFLQSHAAILGTSRSAHYSVLHDENNFNADSLQALSFALCHNYARATRSVSIPTPVYYADIVCARAKNHYSPAENIHVDDSASVSASDSGATQRLEQFRDKYRPLHDNQKKMMYFL